MDERLGPLIERALDKGDVQALNDIAGILDELGMPAPAVSVVEDVERLSARKQGCDRALQEAAQAYLKEAVPRFFKKHKTIKSFSWRQHSPGWTEGETGRFQAHYKYDMETVFEDGASIHEEQSAKKGAISMLNRLGEDALRLALGDGYTITVTRDGISKEHYWDEY